MSKSDPPSTKEIVVLFGAFVLAMASIVVAVNWAGEASPEQLLKALLGAVVGLGFVVSSFVWLARQDSKRDVRKHVRVYHSQGPKN